MSFVTVFLASCVLVGLGVAAMAVGSLLGRPVLRGGCGCGVASRGGDHESCGKCTRDTEPQTAGQVGSHHAAQDRKR